MSMGRSETTDGDEEEQAAMLIRAMTEKNVKKIENALAKTKKHGKGFVLSSHFYKPKPRQQTQKEREKPVQPCMPIVIGSPIGTPLISRKPTPTNRNNSPPRTKSANPRRTKLIEEAPRPKSAYITEYIPPPIKVDMAIQSEGPKQDEPETPPGTPEVPAEEPQPEITTSQVEAAKKQDFTPPPTPPVQSVPPPSPPLQREEPIGKERKKTTKEAKRINYYKFKRLGLAKRPPQFEYEAKMPPSSYDKNPENPEPAHPYVWMTELPSTGGDVTTPFYMKLEVPEGALRDDVIMKFETLSYNRSFLDLDETEKLCSDIIDVNMTPLTYCLHQDATVRLRILEECINKFDDIIIVSARNFKWTRRPTRIETVTVNGDEHHYAVASTQALGKFAAITTRKMDRFIMTTAGGCFVSTSLPEVTVGVREGLLTNFNHLVEVSMEEAREEALTRTSQTIERVSGIEGELIASSPVLSITKDIMGKTGCLREGVEFPGNVEITLPVTTSITKLREKPRRWREPTIKILQKVLNSGWNIDQTAPDLPETWKDITAKATAAIEHLPIESGAGVKINTVVPCQLMVLVFDLGPSKTGPTHEAELSQVCERFQEINSRYAVTIMVHRRVNMPEIINIHMVPVSATGMIQEAMETNEEWERLGEPSINVRLKERERVTINFKGNLKLAMNQMDSEIIFHSRRWRGYQYQVEATEAGFLSSAGEAIDGAIDFVDEGTRTIHTVNVTLPHDKAKPYKATVIEKPLPKVTVMREYKLKWLKSLSAAEKEKYKSINTP